MFKFNFFNICLFTFILIFVIIIFFDCVFISIFNSDEIFNNFSDYTFYNSDFIWPTPDYTTLTSYFGKRVSPTSGASSNHSGIDIGAPTRFKYSCNSRWNHNIFTVLMGHGGYTITLKNNNFTISYCHVSPDFIVYVGQHITQGSVIGSVGPKNVYGIQNNPYKDSNGNPTNGATTRSPPPFNYKKRRHSRQSFRLFIKLVFIVVMMTIFTIIITIIASTIAIVIPVKFYFIITFWTCNFI